MLGLSWSYAQCIWLVYHVHRVVVEGVKMVHAQEFCLGGATSLPSLHTLRTCSDCAFIGHGMPWAISSVPDPKNSGSHPQSPAIPVLRSDTTTERWWSAGPQLPNISRTCGTASTFVPLWIEVWRRVQVQAYLGGFKYVFLSPAWNCYITINPHHEHPWNEFENHKELIENPAFEFGSFVLHMSLSIPYVPITSVDLGACKY